MDHIPWGTDIMVVGDFNTDLADIEGNGKDEAITAALTDEGLEETYGHFLP